MTSQAGLEVADSRDGVHNACIRDGQLTEDDYRPLADDATLPDTGRVIVTLATWSALREPLLRATRLTVGVSVPNTAHIDEIWPQLADRPLIELQFPAFGDGRAYSQARVLRDRYGYTGELRARGAAVVVDQAAQLARCGFNAYVLRADQNAAEFLARLRHAAETAWYQRPSKRPLPSASRL